MNKQDLIEKVHDVCRRYQLRVDDITIQLEGVLVMMGLKERLESSHITISIPYDLYQLLEKENKHTKEDDIFHLFYHDGTLTETSIVIVDGIPCESLEVTLVKYYTMDRKEDEKNIDIIWSVLKKKKPRIFVIGESHEHNDIFHSQRLLDRLAEEFKINIWYSEMINKPKNELKEGELIILDKHQVNQEHQSCKVGGWDEGYFCDLRGNQLTFKRAVKHGYSLANIDLPYQSYLDEPLNKRPQDYQIQRENHMLHMFKKYVERTPGINVVVVGCDHLRHTRPSRKYHGFNQSVSPFRQYLEEQLKKGRKDICLLCYADYHTEMKKV